MNYITYWISFSSFLVHMPQVFLSSYIVFIFLKHSQSCLTLAFSSFSLPSLLPSFTHQHLAYVFIFPVHLPDLVCNNRYDPSPWEGLGKLFFLCQIQSRHLHFSFFFPQIQYLWCYKVVLREKFRGVAEF